MEEFSRRRFLEFMGRIALLTGGANLLPACATRTASPDTASVPTIKPTRADDLVLADGLHSHVVVSWGDELNAKGERFGFNNDFTAFFAHPSGAPDEGLLWVNHEYHDPYYTRGWRPGHVNTAEDAIKDRREVGGSIVHIRRAGGRWQPVRDSVYNRRIDGLTPIPLVSERPIAGSRTAIGTIANCAGGTTPWGTVLSCEENYFNFLGDAVFDQGNRRLTDAVEPYLSYGRWSELPPEHYGWVVEIEPRTGKARKLTALGRFAHESATTRLAADGRTVVYMGDDTDQEHLYKFIAEKPGSLERGDLYVADTVKGRWLPLDRRKDERLRRAFKDRTELLVRTREAAKIVGATPLNRPEDIEIDPATGALIIALSMSSKTKDKFGSLLRVEEKGADPLSLEFNATTYISGGPETGFSNPDNMAFDRRGNLWLCTDMSESKMYRGDHARFANNGLFYIPFTGPKAGVAHQLASAPCSAEFTGPSFSRDGTTLFLSVQHPGEHVLQRPDLASHWPDGGSATPRPSVVAITGPTLQRLLS